MTKFKIERLDRSSFSLWNEFVASVPGGTVFHTTRWLERIGPDPMVIVVVDRGGGIVAGFAGVATKKLGVNGLHIPPYTPYFGPLFRPSIRVGRAAARSEVCSALGALLDAIPPMAHLDFKMLPEQTEAVPYLMKGFTSSMALTHHIAGPVEAYEKNLGRSPRSYLRKLHALVESGDLRVTADAHRDEILELWAATADRRGFRFHRGVLQRLIEPSSPRLRWNVAATRGGDGRLLSVALYLEDDRRAYNLLNATRPGLKGLIGRSNLLTLDSAIRATLKKNKVLDLEGSVLPGVEAFYRSLGGAPVATWRFQRSRSALYSAARCVRRIMTERRASSRCTKRIASNKRERAS